jgi:hypothetical protein
VGVGRREGRRSSPRTIDARIRYPSRMGESRRRRGLKALGGAVASAAFAYAMSSSFVDRVLADFHDRFIAMNPDSMPAAVLLDRLYHASGSALGTSFLVLLVAAALLPLGYVARTVARARVRAGGRDVLASAQRWTMAHPSAVRALTALPSSALAAWVAYRCYELPGYGQVPLPALIGMMALWAIPAVFAAIGWTALARAGLRALVAPVLDDEEAMSKDVAAGEISFDAVAVTRETRAAIGATAALTVAMVAWIATLTPTVLFHDARVGAAVLVYVAVTLGGAALFRRASRIAIGLDGVFVTGSSRTRFFAYRDLDYAHADGSDLILVRGTRVVLRLQLHGKDAARREAVLERLRLAIRAAHEGRKDPATDFVAAASREVLARAAHGAGDYRASALSVEQLWAIVEGPSLDGEARANAASALVGSGGAEARARLRVAAEHCADPRVRVALQGLCAEDEPEDEAEVAVVARPPRSLRGTLP